MEVEKKAMIEYHYFEQFAMSELQDILDYLNKEQALYGRIIEMDADDHQKVFVIRRIKFNSNKKAYPVQSLCSQKVDHHLKIGDCDYAIRFDLRKK